ncbi:MAG: diguanylate cyclase [Gammaproteobacteria bacterium]|nr:diguanylate cyclase [Gammaproteobacteria bacterium]
MNPLKPKITALATGAAHFVPSIRYKMVVVMAVVLALSFSLAGWWTLHDQQQAVVRETRARGEDLATLMARNMAPLVIGYDYQAIQLALAEYGKLPDIAHARVMSARGNPMGEAGGKLPDNPDLVFEKPIVFADKTIGTLMVGLNNESIVAKMNKERKALVWRESLLALLIALAEFLALSYLVIRPLTTIARSLRHNLGADGSVHAEIPIRSADEFGLIARLFNDLRQQLNAARDKLNTKIELADARLIEANRQLSEQAQDLKKLNEELTQLAITDQLTCLYNRRQFDAMMAEELELCRRYGDTHVLIMADVDSFKDVNDRFGHDVGDRVLCVMADRLRESTRKTDVLFRLGGEEFGVLCRRVNRNEGWHIAEKLRQTIAASPFTVHDQAINVTASFGVAEMTPSHTLREIYRLADTALYRSKRGGRNRVSVHVADVI